MLSNMGIYRQAVRFLHIRKQFTYQLRSISKVTPIRFCLQCSQKPTILIRLNSKSRNQNTVHTPERIERIFLTKEVPKICVKVLFRF